MLDSIKLALRITNNAFNSEIEDLIDSARLDLIQSGISVNKANSETDPLIKRAVTFYCKAYFGMHNPDAEKFAHSYDLLKQHLTLAGDYKNGNSVE